MCGVLELFLLIHKLKQLFKGNKSQLDAKTLGTLRKGYASINSCQFMSHDRPIWPCQFIDERDGCAKEI